MKSRVPNKRITMSDVAQAAGVSAITVSRVINQPGKVSSELCQRVQKVIDDLGYIPNHSASALATSRSGVIGVVIPSLSNVVFNEVLRGIYDVAGPAGYQVLLTNSHYSPLEEEKSIRMLLSQSPEALIISGGDQTDVSKNMLTRSGVPVVQIMETVKEPIDMNVGFSHYQAGYDIVDKMVEEGYKSIGFLGARMDPRAQRRLEGYQQALNDRGVDLPEDFIVTTLKSSSVALGGELLKSLMAVSDGKCDAVFCCNDDLALGALFECQRMHIKVPSDIAISGFNDIESAELVHPPLTSVHVPRYTMGEKATQMLIGLLKGEEISEKVVDTGYEIKWRQST